MFKIIYVCLIIVTLMLSACNGLSTKQISDTNVETNISDPEMQNDFFGVLDTLKNVQPGTAGSSLKIASASYKLINACKSRLPLDKIASEWINKQDKQDFSNINEAFTSVYDSIDQFRDSENIKGVLADVGIVLPNDTDFNILVDEAKKVLKVVIDATK